MPPNSIITSPSDHRLDAAESAGRASDASSADEDAPIDISSLTGQGLGELRDRLVHAAYSGALGLQAEAPLVTRERHARQLRAARDEVAAFLEARSRKLAAEVATTHLRSAAQALEELVGVIGTEDILGHVFSQFCVGK